MVASLIGEHRYEKIKALGEGTFGVVSKARDRSKKKGDKDRIVAIKKIRMGHRKDGVNITALREIKLLQELSHPNVIGLLDVYAGKNNVNMVIEYCVTDLEEVIRDRTVFLTPAEIKCCTKMILEGINKCHEKWVLHRDLKPSNILIGADGNLKIADFGLARLHASPKARLTHQVITRWYRPPELLYAARTYGPSVDIWSIGCIFAELILRIPYLPGDSDIDQLSKIFQARGTPTKEDWPDHDSLPAFVQFKETPPPDQSQFFLAASAEGLDLMNKMLHLNPQKRISAEDALKHPYFATEQPPPCDAKALLEKIRSGSTVKDKGSPDEEPDESEADDPKSESQNAPSDVAKAIGQRKLSFS